MHPPEWSPAREPEPAILEIPATSAPAEIKRARGRCRCGRRKTVKKTGREVVFLCTGCNEPLPGCMCSDLYGDADPAQVRPDPEAMFDLQVSLLEEAIHEREKLDRLIEYLYERIDRYGRHL